jgi:hypothetical protein
MTIWAASGLEVMALGAAVAELAVSSPDWSTAPLFAVDGDDLIQALLVAGFEQSFARTVEVLIPVRSAEPLVEHFTQVFDLDSERRAELARRIEASLAERRDLTGVALLPNPAVLAAARVMP